MLNCSNYLQWQRLAQTSCLLSDLLINLNAWMLIRIYFRWLNYTSCLIPSISCNIIKRERKGQNKALEWLLKCLIWSCDALDVKLAKPDLPVKRRCGHLTRIDEVTYRVSSSEQKRSVARATGRTDGDLAISNFGTIGWPMLGVLKKNGIVEGSATAHTAYWSRIGNLV